MSDFILVKQHKGVSIQRFGDTDQYVDTYRYQAAVAGIEDTIDRIEAVFGPAALAAFAAQGGHFVIANSYYNTNFYTPGVDSIIDQVPGMTDWYLYHGASFVFLDYSQKNVPGTHLLQSVNDARGVTEHEFGHGLGSLLTGSNLLDFAQLKSFRDAVSLDRMPDAILNGYRSTLGRVNGPELLADIVRALLGDAPHYAHVSRDAFLAATQITSQLVRLAFSLHVTLHDDIDLGGGAVSDYMDFVSRLGIDAAQQGANIEFIELPTFEPFNKHPVLLAPVGAEEVLKDWLLGAGAANFTIAVEDGKLISISGDTHVTAFVGYTIAEALGLVIQVPNEIVSIQPDLSARPTYYLNADSVIGEFNQVLNNWAIGAGVPQNSQLSVYTLTPQGGMSISATYYKGDPVDLFGNATGIYQPNVVSMNPNAFIDVGQNSFGIYADASIALSGQYIADPVTFTNLAINSLTGILGPAATSLVAGNIGNIVGNSTVMFNPVSPTPTFTFTPITLDNLIGIYSNQNVIGAFYEGGGLTYDESASIGDKTARLFNGTTAVTESTFNALDTNSDGVINSADSGYANLKVWQDMNEDGVVDDGEMKSLSDAGMTSIPLRDKELRTSSNAQSVVEQDVDALHDTLLVSAPTTAAPTNPYSTPTDSAPNHSAPTDATPSDTAPSASAPTVDYDYYRNSYSGGYLHAFVESLSGDVYGVPGDGLELSAGARCDQAWRQRLAGGAVRQGRHSGADAAGAGGTEAVQSAARERAAENDRGF